MLKIKLARFGKKNQPHYRIVVNEARDKRDGKYIANLGTYAPAQSPKILEINIENYEAWVKKGAQPTETVSDLVTRFKSGEPFPAKKQKPSKKTIAKQQAAKEAAEAEAAQPTEAVSETPAAEVVEATDAPVTEEATT